MNENYSEKEMDFYKQNKSIKYIMIGLVATMILLLTVFIAYMAVCPSNPTRSSKCQVAFNKDTAKVGNRKMFGTQCVIIFQEDSLCALDSLSAEKELSNIIIEKCDANDSARIISLLAFVLVISSIVVTGAFVVILKITREEAILKKQWNDVYIYLYKDKETVSINKQRNENDALSNDIKSLREKIKEKVECDYKKEIALIPQSIS